MQKIGLILSSLSLVACQSSGPTASQLTNRSTQSSAVSELAPSIRPLTKLGENKEAQFSPSGEDIIFISKNRKRHKNSQLYTLHLSSGKQRRISYQDGEIKNPMYSTDGQSIIYSSTTDEIKENPLFIKNRLQTLKDRAENIDLISAPFLTGSELLPYEIYISHSDGRDIQRLTSQPNLDHEPSLHPRKNLIVFSSVRAGGLELFSLDLSNKKTKQLTSNHMFNDEPSFSPDGESLVWVRYSPKIKESHIFVSSDMAKTRRKITRRSADHWSPVWHPNSQWIIFSANIDDESNFDLYMISLQGNCLQRLTSNKAFDGYPAINKTGDKLLFTSERSGRSQVYLMDLKTPSSCLADNS